MPTPRSVAEIKSKLLQPALTSHFEVKIPIPPGLRRNPKYLEANGLSQFALKQDTLNLLCSETILPGSTVGLMDITGDYHGVTQRHANRRIYDDRIDMTFYVDAENYLPIRYFETWIKYIVGESITSSGGRPGSQSENYFYRLNYPKDYICEQGLEVTKFEKSYKGKTLTYKFINSFPVAITSMPVSYDASSLLRCTVSFSYIRYVITPIGNEPTHNDSEGSSAKTSGDPSSPNFSLTPQQLSNINSQSFDPNVNLGELYTTTGGVNYSTALASGNSITQADINSELAAERKLTANQ